MSDISIIIPVYNVERYLGRCLESLMTQTMSDFEVVCVNDGSQDASREVLRHYETKMPLTVYDQPNQGPSVARNVGMQQAHGSYYVFIDADDYVDNDYVETLYRAIKDTDYDIVMSGFRKTDGHTVSFERRLDDGAFAKYVVTGPVGKIYRAAFLREHHLEFPITTSSEDVIFNLTAIAGGARIKTLPYVGYAYFDNLQSLSNTMHKGFQKDVHVVDLLNAVNFESVPDRELHQYYLIRYCVWYLLYSGKTATPAQFMDEYHELFGWLEQHLDSYTHNKYIRVLPAGEQADVHRYIHIFMMLHKAHLVRLFAQLYCRPA